MHVSLDKEAIAAWRLAPLKGSRSFGAPGLPEDMANRRVLQDPRRSRSSLATEVDVTTGTTNPWETDIHPALYPGVTAFDGGRSASLALYCPVKKRIPPPGWQVFEKPPVPPSMERAAELERRRTENPSPHEVRSLGRHVSNYYAGDPRSACRALSLEKAQGLGLREFEEGLWRLGWPTRRASSPEDQRRRKQLFKDLGSVQQQQQQQQCGDGGPTQRLVEQEILVARVEEAPTCGPRGIPKVEARLRTTRKTGFEKPGGYIPPRQTPSERELQERRRLAAASDRVAIEKAAAISRAGNRKLSAPVRSSSCPAGPRLHKGPLGY